MAERSCPECDGSGDVPDNDYYDALWGKVLTDAYHAYCGTRRCRVCGGSGRVEAAGMVRSDARKRLEASGE